jgi:hypothetical protein
MRIQDDEYEENYALKKAYPSHQSLPISAQTASRYVFNRVHRRTIELSFAHNAREHLQRRIVHGLEPMTLASINDGGRVVATSRVET